MIQQAAPAILMVRPAAFGYNPETATTNLFQKKRNDDKLESIKTQALEEFDRMVDVLRASDIQVLVADDIPEPIKPDAIFPNNWISFHPDGRVILYPMQAANRRMERRLDIIEWLRTTHRVSEVLDESSFEQEGRFCEGTGSLIFDHPNKLIYACRSPRTDEGLVERIGGLLGYHTIIFDAVDESGHAIYHTNVMMCVGSRFAVVCLDAIRSESDQDAVLDSLAQTEHKVVAISYEQMRAFAGNMIEVADKEGLPNVLLSQTAFDTLLPGQIDAISRFAEMIPLSIPTIEQNGGGSVRCMVAGIFLPRINS